ncbi:GDP-mannose mannosyl hydrolase [Moraxella caprae]|uniref:GDP-mannose mannosyl hydrolase n=1 Tax=Moraxella caprae TaxID=90240 RepID=A0A378QZ90_9GAMM|nr:GDP-mannose mannosyl hydrolase [Moraxella caprae]STZ07767.1 GDP-mannose mannosyl hydrolase [Moraxella caprae]
MFLNQETFCTIIDNTPLISIDLIVKNHQGQVLLGKRNNPPAKNFWFVVGGRIRKNEKIADAFIRLTHQELGQSFSLNKARFIAPYQHFYDDSILGDDIATHYVVLAYELVVDDLNDLPIEQHSDYRWFDIDELMIDIEVHQYTKDYFKE